MNSTRAVFHAVMLNALSMILIVGCAANKPHLNQPKGFMVGRVTTKDSGLRQQPVFMIKDSKGKTFPAPTTWLSNNYFLIELPPDEYEMSNIYFIRQNASGIDNNRRENAMIINAKIPFQIKHNTAVNLGEITVEKSAGNIRKYDLTIFENNTLGLKRLSNVLPGSPDPRDKTLFKGTIGPIITNPRELDRIFVAERHIPDRVKPKIKDIQPLLCSTVPGFCYTDDNNYNPRWNWQDRNGYANWYGVGLPPPWGASHHIGVNVTNYDHPTNQGWRLYTKRMTCEDSNVDCSNDPLRSDNVNDGPMPYFALYNIHTGLLRTFLYINEENYTGDQKLVANIGVVQEGPYVSDLGYAKDLFSNALSLAITENSDNAVPIIYVSPALFNRWVVIDQEITYSPTEPIANGLMFSIDFSGVAETDIEVGGDLQLEKQTVLGGNKSGVQRLWDNKDKVSDSFNSPNDWVEGMKKKGKKLEEKDSRWKQDTGAALVKLAEQVAPAVPYVGAILAGYEIFTSFWGSSPGGIQSEFFEGSISLAGTLKLEHPLGSVKFGIHQSDHADTTNKSELAFDGRIGLYSLKQLPSMNVYLDGLTVGKIDVKDLLNLNLESNMKLSAIDASLLIDLNHYVVCPSSVGQFENLQQEVLIGDYNYSNADSAFWTDMCDNTTFESA